LNSRRANATLEAMIGNVVILAGGSGTRLWPASRVGLPKQFLEIGGGRSLLQRAVERALALAPSGRIVVVTHAGQAQAAREHARAVLPPTALASFAVLAEPEARNTAPAVAYACAWLAARGGAQLPIAVLAADHVIEPRDRFAAAASRAADLAATGRLVVFGVRPLRPDTGYGYLEAGPPVPGGLEVRRFHEKPDAERARAYLRAGTYYWNSGMFVFEPAVFLEEARALAPQVVAPLQGAPAALAGEPVDSVVEPPEALRAAYRDIPSISIDYAVMEKSHRVAMVPAEFEWSDVGTWDEVARLGGGSGLAASVDASGNYVLSDIPVALAGVSDLLVVIRNGAALVCRRNGSQLVRGVVDKLKADGRTDLL
jgi:mannose-1-phosphate guanylyltransferase/mannose-6-phosphate isomerase